MLNVLSTIFVHGPILELDISMMKSFVPLKKVTLKLTGNSSKGRTLRSVLKPIVDFDLNLQILLLIYLLAKLRMVAQVNICHC